MNFWTSPIYIHLFFSTFSISFAILEAMLILHFNRIPSANAWNEGPIYQDIMFSQNNVFYAPVILCKNKFNANEDFGKFYSVDSWLCSNLWIVMISPTVLMEHLHPLLILEHFQLSYLCPGVLGLYFRYLKPCSSCTIIAFFLPMQV